MFLLLDHWHPLGPLYKKYGERVVYNLGRSLLTKVDSIIYQETWKWPRQRNAVSREIIALTPASLIPNCLKEDKLVWIPNSNGVYTAASAWRSIRASPMVSPGLVSTPHSKMGNFIQWLALHGLLATKDMLFKLGVVSSGTCALCNFGLKPILTCFLNVLFQDGYSCIC